MKTINDGGGSSYSPAPESIHLLSTAIAGIFLLSLPHRLWTLQKSRLRISPGPQRLVKTVVGIILCILLVLNLSEISQHARDEPFLIVSLSTSLAAALGLSILLYQEQCRAFEPSDIPTLYLLASVLCDVVALTMPHEVRRPPPSRCLLHAVLLMLETFVPSVRDREKKVPEEESSLLSRVFFGWINPILLRGYRSLLVIEDLPLLSTDMSARLSRESMLSSWSRRAEPETKLTLPLALLRSIRRFFLAPVLPRLLVVLFRYAQPPLIRQSISFVTAESSETAGSETRGYWLIVSAIVTYAGLAISAVTYQHRLNRLRVVTKSALVGIIHDKVINSPSAAHGSSEAVTLMSTDTEGLDGVPEMFHEIWAQTLEVVAGIVLLSREVGWISPLPLILIFLCSRVSRYVAKHLPPGQKAWNVATQRRVTATSSMLGSMKVIKMLGLQHCMGNSTQSLRKEELSTASKVRWIMVYYNASANALGIFTPAITLVLFAVTAAWQGRALDTETAFTTMAILSMVTHPANMVMTHVPRAFGAFVGFERIQTYLLKPQLSDEREVLATDGQGADLAIKLQDVVLGDEHRPILNGVSVDAYRGSFVFISGSVGAGKSTLLKAILGEVPCAQGSVALASRRVAYYAQQPWLPGGTIKDTICGMDYNNDENDDRWYQRVIDACCLSYDLELLPDGDQTQIGSGGLNLSGGQRQRVALARAVFSRCPIALLDDVFSALDGETEKTVFQNLFGSAGLFRQLGTTVVLVTNSTQFFPAADRIALLEGGIVKAQGSWEAIKHEASSAISKFTSQPRPESDAGTSTEQASAKRDVQLRAGQEAKADLARKTGDLGLYWYYFRFVGLMNLAVLMACIASYSFSITIPQQWLKLWTESRDQNQSFYVCGFMLLALASWASTSTGMWSTLIKVAPNSGLLLHEHLLKIVTNAPLSFFSEHNHGSILNRFTQDMQLIDKPLPMALQHCQVQISKLLMQVILLCLAQKILGLSLPLCAALVYVVQKLYLRTSRQLRFLELESRAGVLSSFLESIEGLETIRAFGWLGEATVQNTTRLEDSQRAEFLLMCLQRWLNLVLDLIAAAVAVAIITTAVVLRGQVSGGQVGVALNLMLVANTTLLKLVEAWTNLEVSLGAVARLKTLERTTPPESDAQASFEPPRGWPTQGRIEFKGVTAAYNSKAVALHDVTVTFEPGQKITICGRTGSGKSSLLLALLRLLDLQSGHITLDGVDITNIPRDILRRRCFVTVSQEGLLLPHETLRFNVDPEGLLGGDRRDQTVVDALDRANLWHHFLQTSKQQSSNGNNQDPAQPQYQDDPTSPSPILDRKLSDFPALSAGQTQIFALCRAMLKVEALRTDGARPVVLVDEVTSALDATAEAAVQQIIDSEFVGKGHTLLMISHRQTGSASGELGRETVVQMRDGRVEEASSGSGGLIEQMGEE